jgi:ribosomal protein L17
MRHHNRNRKFGRKRKVRNALLNSLARNLILRGKIKTTLPKAKELRPFVERLVTLGKKNTLSSQRLAQSRLGGRGGEVRKLFTSVAPKYKDRNGGYTRVLKLGNRMADGAPMAIIEFV